MVLVVIPTFSSLTSYVALDLPCFLCAGNHLPPPKVSLKDVALTNTHNICFIFYCFRMILPSSVLLSLKSAFEAYSIFISTYRGRPEIGRLMLAGRLEGRELPGHFGQATMRIEPPEL